MNLHLAKSNSDLKFLFETRRHPLVSTMLTGDPPSDFSQHFSYILKVQEKTKWILIATDNKTPIGYGQIYDIQEKQLEVGFVVHPDFQGKGYGKELVFETVKKAEDLFPNKKIILYVKKENFKAIHIYKKFGFMEKNIKDNTVYMEREG